MKGSINNTIHTNMDLGPKANWDNLFRIFLIIIKHINIKILKFNIFS